MVLSIHTASGSAFKASFRNTAMTSWISNLNRWAKIELHIIALGELNVDLPSLQQLADAVGGDVLHVPEK